MMLRWISIPLLLSLAACSTMGEQPSTPFSLPSSTEGPATAAPASNPSGRLVLVMPATGGPPVQAISTGGATFLPVSGGLPIVGTPIGP